MVNDLSTLTDVAEIIAPRHRGVIGLNLEGGLGVDLRFAEDASVLVLTENLPEPEDSHQMAGRGVRSFADKEAHIYYVGA